MLQQTQVATVIDYYHRFLERLPDVKQLASANESEVLKLWEGLGYYRRARQMHAAANVIVDQHGGRFPTDFDEVLALPGIGRYTAGAILSIALDQSHPILEGNTVRLFARLMEMKSDPRISANQKAQWEFSKSLLPRKRVGDFNQSLMELGSEICHPKRPKCLICPIRDLCPTNIKGLQESIPVSGKKTKYEEIQEAVILVQRKGKFLIRQCEPGERWAGLWDFPRFAMPEESPAQHLRDRLESLTGIAAELELTEQSIKHAVTRFRITLRCYRAIDVTGRLKRSGSQLKWLTPKQIDDTPMSVTGRKIAKTLDQI